MDRASDIASESGAISDTHSLRSVDTDGFRIPAEVAKKARRQERHRRKIITGNATSCAGRFKGAPEPNRDLFIFRVHPSTDISDLRVYVLDAGFDVRALDCISNAKAKYKSFRLTVPASQFADLFNESLWPSGVRVRKYVPPVQQGDDY